MKVTYTVSRQFNGTRFRHRIDMKVEHGESGWFCGALVEQFETAQDVADYLEKIPSTVCIIWNCDYRAV